MENLIANFKIDEIQDIFEKYLELISRRINLNPIARNVKIILGEEDIFESELLSPLGLVLREKYQDNRLLIRISKKFPHFIPIILLREAYFCFLKESLRNNIQMHFFIYMLIELDLSRYEYIDEWKEQVRKINVYSQFFTFQYDSVKKFLQFKYPNSERSLISTLFHFLRTLDSEVSYEYLYRVLIRIHMKSLKQVYGENENLLETIRVLNIIFNKVKSYRALLDYQKYFKQFKEKGILHTSLSLRAFISNVRWLSQYSYCSPIYLLNWNAINISFLYIHIRFHPILPWFKIDKFLSQLPFNLISQFLPTGFSKEYFGYFIIPNSYLQDLRDFLIKLKESGYLLIADLFPILKGKSFYNLNYYLDNAEVEKFVPSFVKQYNKKLVLNSELEYIDATFMSELSLFDFLIIERARQLSLTGFSFERRESTLSSLKDDLLNELSKQKRIISDLRNLLKEISQNSELRNTCTDFIVKNQKDGFFIIYNYVSQICSIIEQLRSFLKENQKKMPISELINRIENQGLSSSLDKNLILKNSKMKAFLIQNLYPLYLNSQNKFLQKAHNYSILLKLLEICMELKLYDISSIRNIIQDPKLFRSIYKEKKKKIEDVYAEILPGDITSNEVESRLEKFVNKSPPIIQPQLTNSLVTLIVEKNIFIFLLNSTPEVLSKIQDLAMETPRLSYLEIKCDDSKQNIIYCLLNLPHMDINELSDFITTFHHLFQGNLISCNKVLFSGITEAFTRRNFYDFINKEFFYTSALFEQYLLYSRKLFGKNIPLFKETEWNIPVKNLFKRTTLKYLIEEVNSNRDQEDIIYEDFKKLTHILTKIEPAFEDKSYWSNLKKDSIFSHYIKSIKFEPFLSHFGLQKYYLYFRPMDMAEIDFKLLLSNTFQSLKFSEVSKSSYIFFIKYVFPFNNPNLSYINWLLFSKKNISEYCLFTIKKVYLLHNVFQNVEIEDKKAIWNLDFSLFLTYVQEILFNKQKINPKANYKIITILEKIKKENFAPYSSEFTELVSIYPHKTRNLKYIGSLPKDEDVYAKVNSFIKKKIGMFNVKTSNLNLHQNVVFIIPSINETAIRPILDIFRFFNKVHIHEIEGEYYLHSFLKVKSFEHGLYIKIWFPDIDISDFIEYLSRIFTYLGISHVLLITELVDGNHFLSQLFNDVDLKNDYNPIINLNWNPIDKIWMNSKLFNEKFEPIYPPLKPKLDASEITENNIE